MFFCFISLLIVSKLSDVCVLRCSLPAFVFRYLIPKSLEQAQRRHQTTQPAVLTVKVRMMLSV